MSARYFSVVGPKGETYGRYKGSSPGSAASKAFTQLARSKSVNGDVKLKLRETTSGSGHKTYEYKCKKVKLAKPVVREIAGKKITIRNKNKIQRIKK